MKRLLLLLSCIATTSISIAQIIPGGDMESWRSSSSGGSTPLSVQAPFKWYGADSIIIGLGQAFGTLIGADDSSWHRNLFEETSIVHSGSKAAKVMTVMQDTLLLPGVLSTAQTHIGIVFFPTPGITDISFTGGTPVTVKPLTVSAWIQYHPGKDSLGIPGVDSGVLNVQALAHIGSKDSVVGTATLIIPPNYLWTQITANVLYPIDSTYPIDTLRITFTSSKGTGTGLDSSTLYVDDVTMTSTDNPIRTAISSLSKENKVVVYPNPASGKLYFNNPSITDIKVIIYSVSGQQVAEKQLGRTDTIDLSGFASGLYTYSIFDSNNIIVQTGKVSVDNK